MLSNELFDLGEPMPSEMPKDKVDEATDLPFFGPENRPAGWVSNDDPPPTKTTKPDIWVNSEEPSKPVQGSEAKPSGWRSSSPLPPTHSQQQPPPPRKAPIRQSTDPVNHRFKRYVRVPRTVRTEKPPEPTWEHNPPPQSTSPTKPVFGPEPRPPGWVSPKPPTPLRRSPIQRQTSDAATLTDVESPVRRPIRNTPPRKRTPPSNAVNMPPPPAASSMTVSLDTDDEMYWRSSWQDKNAGKLEVSGLLAYTAQDAPPKQHPSTPPPPKCVYHPDCDGNCQ